VTRLAVRRRLLLKRELVVFFSHEFGNSRARRMSPALVTCNGELGARSVSTDGDESGFDVDQPRYPVVQ